MVKTRMQLKGEAKAKASVIDVCKTLFTKEGGVRAFYRGIGSALMRQVVYTTMRLGIFYTVLDTAKQKRNKALNPFEKGVASITAGAISAFMANPFDLALIRFQADGTLPAAERRNYRNVFHALYRIISQEGVVNLWKGATPTIVRAMALNLGMLTPYEECKQRFKKYWGDTKTTYFAASCVAGFLAAFMCLPFDNVKTKVQKMKRLPDGTYPYKGFFDGFRKSIVNEGVTKLWIGFPVFYVRIGGHAMLTLLFSDTFKYYFGHYFR
eukprot:TRINITY_DN5164_c0_g1_i10.p1 TRINITY_DN5164_c0_g1~~TRINITY_DN5164_c0_g1_i10.p1  ORF type:complete len:267 (+),score=88.33 TRINITY_DN5164_c0_g1_i10:455-1255(+)